MTLKSTTVAFIGALLLCSCGKQPAKTASPSSDDATKSATNSALVSAPAPAPILTAGGTAFVRVKQYSLFSGEAIRDSFGGTGYVLQNLHPSGIELATAKPGRAASTIHFGDMVTLVDRKAGPPVMWQVADGQTKIRVPEFLLTANKAEIDFLRKTDRIPESMVLVYKAGGILKIWGTEVMGEFSVVDSHGLAFLDYPTGTSPFAVKGNAVIFDDSAVESLTKFEKPPVFDTGKKGLEVSSSSLYYCVAEGPNAAFERIDLKSVR